MEHTEYQVTIKSANQKVDDYVTICRPHWTVHRLKQHISETHINKPKVEDQRLIYAGNLLKDSFTLKQIFFRDSLCTELTNSNKTDFTLHLVCQLPRTSEQSSNFNSSTNHPSATPSSATPSPAQNVPASTRSEEQPHQAQMIQSLMQSDQMRQQMAAFQELSQLVAAQLATSLANGTLPQLLSNANRIEVQTSVPVINQPAPQAPVDPGAPAAQHDIIDWVYYSTRALILIAALYIHASMYRLLFLFGMLAIAFYFNRRPGRGQAAAAENNANDVNNNPAAARDQVPAEDGGGDRAPARLPFLKLCYLVVTDFLASLVPE